MTIQKFYVYMFVLLSPELEIVFSKQISAYRISRAPSVYNPTKRAYFVVAFVRIKFKISISPKIGYKDLYKT